MKEVYPKHIYDPIRREVANSYVRHELRKYLPSVNNWQLVDKDIDAWFDGSTALYPVRDYWNGVHGIMMGFKLYNQLLSFITAENVTWSRERIKLKSLTYTDFGEYTPYHLNDEPIIVTQKEVEGVDKLVVYDGNNRVNQAVKKGGVEIEAFIGRFNNQKRQPENYWLPTSTLMEVTEFAKRSFGEKQFELYESYVKILTHMLSYSESGRYEMRERVLSKESDFKAKLLTDLSIV